MLNGSQTKINYSTNMTFELSIDNARIEQVFLWNHLNIDENLTSHFHIDKLCKKIASAIKTS